MSDTKTSFPSRANKRSRDEVRLHREYLSDWLLQGYTQQEMADMILDKFGVSITREQVAYDIGKIRKEWRETTIDNYQEHINQELAWLDSYERELWRDYRSSKEGITQKRIEKVLAEIDDALDEGRDADLVVSRIVETHGESHGDTRFLELIYKARQERRKLLGLYAPHLVGIKVEKTETINIKGYADVVSPSRWPSIEGKTRAIEGEIVDGKNKR